MSEVDVVVAGAGPAGATTAMLFARNGYQTVLLDRAHFPRPKACAEYMSPGVVRTLDALNLYSTVSALRPAEVPGMDIISPRGRSLSVTYGDATAWTLSRHEFDEALVRQARSAGVEVREGFVVRDVLRTQGVVTGVSGSRNGEPADVTARLTIVADGSHSVLARRLGLSRAPRWPVRLGLVAYYRGTPELIGGRGQMHVGSGGYCGIAPLPGGCLNVAVVAKLDAPRRAHSSATEFFQNWISASPGVSRLLRDCERVTSVRGVGPVGSRVSRSSLPGCLLVGDAASFFDPFTGEGIHRALRSAQIATEVGSAALASRTETADGLFPYESIRRSEFRDKAGVTALVQLFVQYPLLMEYALPRLGRRPVQTEALSMVLGDLRHARAFLNPSMLWGALRP